MTNDQLAALHALLTSVAHDRPYLILLFATLPIVFLMMPFRRMSVVTFILAAAVTGLLWVGLDLTAAALVLLGGSLFLSAADVLNLRRRIGTVERRTVALERVVNELELAYERRQSFMARSVALPQLVPADGPPSPKQNTRDIPEKAFNGSSAIEPHGGAPPDRK